MTDNVAVCMRCGVPQGSASTFARSLCEACAAERTGRRQNRSAVIQVVLLAAGIYAWLAGHNGVIARILIISAAIDLIGIVTTIVHEAAHAFTALALFYRVREVSLGIGPEVGRIGFGRFRLVFRLLPLSGHTFALPRGETSRARHLAVVAAGPLSHLPLAWAATLLLPAGPLADGAVRLVLAHAVINLIPIRNHDGKSILTLLTMPDAAVGGLSKTAHAVSVTLDLQGVEQGRLDASPDQRDPFLAHLADPTISARDRAISLNNLAVIDLYLDDASLLDEADRATAEAMELLPDLPAIRNTRGAVLIARGLDEEGIGLMEPTMARLRPDQRGSSHVSLALGYARSGRVYEARTHISAARALGQASSRLEMAEDLAADEEARVAARYLEGRSPEEAAAVIRRDAGGLAATMARLLLRHVERCGDDGELRRLAEALSR